MIVYPLLATGWQLVIIVLVIVLLFGGKKIPELMKGIGKGIRGFKEGINEEDVPEGKAKKIEPEDE